MVRHGASPGQPGCWPVGRGPVRAAGGILGEGSLGTGVTPERGATMGKRDARGGSARAGGRRADGVLAAIYPISMCMHDYIYVCIYMHLHHHPPPDTGPRVVTGLDVYISTGAVLRTPLAGGRSREPAMGSAVPPPLRSRERSPTAVPASWQWARPYRGRGAGMPGSGTPMPKLGSSHA